MKILKKIRKFKLKTKKKKIEKNTTQRQKD